MAGLRLALATFEEVPEPPSAPASGRVFARRAHLAFFLHDEVIVHAPAEQAEAAAEAIREAADAAGRLLRSEERRVGEEGGTQRAASTETVEDRKQNNVRQRR